MPVEKCYPSGKNTPLMIAGYALLALGIRNIRLGPTLPPFLSPVVVAALQQKYDLKAVTTPENDLQAILGRH